MFCRYTVRCSNYSDAVAKASAPFIVPAFDDQDPPPRLGLSLYLKESNGCPFAGALAFELVQAFGHCAVAPLRFRGQGLNWCLRNFPILIYFLGACSFGEEQGRLK